MPRFAWTPERVEAAELVARSKLTRQQIAEKVGVERRTLQDWLTRPEFKARVAEALAEVAAEVRRIGIADPTVRIATLNDLCTRLRLVIEARADDPTMAKIPGGQTGLLAATVKGVGKKVVRIYTVDVALLREIRDTMRQAAIEVGQWQSTADPTDLNIREAATKKKADEYRDPDHEPADGSPPG